MKQEIFGTHFDYGNVEMSTAASEGAEVTFRAVPEPRAVQRRLNELLEHVKGDGDSSGEAGPDTEDRIIELLEDAHEELRLLRTSMSDQTDHES